MSPFDRCLVSLAPSCTSLSLSHRPLQYIRKYQIHINNHTVQLHKATCDVRVSPRVNQSHRDAQRTGHARTGPRGRPAGRPRDGGREDSVDVGCFLTPSSHLTRGADSRGFERAERALYTRTIHTSLTGEGGARVTGCDPLPRNGSLGLVRALRRRKSAFEPRTAVLESRMCVA